MASEAAELSLLRVARRTGVRWRDRLMGVKRVHMLHIGKTGGTALKAALAHARPNGSRVLLHRHYIRLVDVPVGEPCFFVVRDPVSRFVSGFFSRQRQGRPRYNSAWNDIEREAFAEFATPNELALALSARDPARRHRAEAAMANIGHVRDHLHRWLGDEAYLRTRSGDILFIGSQERLTSDVAALSALLNISIDLPTDEVSSHRNPAHLNRQLDAESVANLRSWYRGDYSFLRLMREWFTHLPEYDEAWPPLRKSGSRD